MKKHIFRNNLEHKKYLQRVLKQGRIDRYTAKKSWRLWLSILKEIGISVPIPCAGTGPDGQMFYSWDIGAHHLEVEIHSYRGTEFFYLNRQTGEIWGEDYTGGILPEDLIAKLRLLL